MTGEPMACGEARGLLDEGLDRDLSPAEEDAVRAHLASCASCSAWEAEARAVHGALSGAEAPPPRPGFEDRLFAALDRAPGSAGPRAPDAPLGVRAARALVGALGTAAVAGAAVLLLPVDAAAALAGGIVPAMRAPALPGLPAAAEALGGLPSLLPPWAAAAGAALAIGAAALAVLPHRAARGRR